MGSKSLAFLLFLSSLSFTAGSMPVAFQGSLGVMSYNQPDYLDWQVNYSITNWIGLGVDGVRDVMGNEQDYLIPRINLLVHRWNGTDYQANIYGYGGVGVGKRDDLVRIAYFFGGEADYETRHVYLSGKASSIQGVDLDASGIYQLRVGVAPYLADFESLQSWLILQAQYFTRASNEQLRIGPVLRFFIRNVLWEAGVTAKGTWSLNFMIHF